MQSNTKHTLQLAVDMLKLVLPSVVYSSYILRTTG